MYADDTVVYLSGKVKEDAERLLNEQGPKLKYQIILTKTIINLKKSKTESIILGTARRLKTAANKRLLQGTDDKQRY